MDERLLDMIKGGRKISRQICTGPDYEYSPKVQKYVANLQQAYDVLVLRYYKDRDENGIRYVTVWAVVKDKEGDSSGG